jgi:uncharacterized Tic20 family protein
MENPMVQTEERTWSMLAHLSAILNLFVPTLGGVIGAGVIYLVFKDKSKQIAFHALQSLVLQGLIAVTVLVVVGGTWVLGFIASFVTFGIGAFIAVPAMILTFFLGFALTTGGTVYAFHNAG